jgi:hypothetical protein
MAKSRGGLGAMRKVGAKAAGRQQSMGLRRSGGARRCGLWPNGL